jgi:hypothetical protein
MEDILKVIQSLKKDDLPQAAVDRSKKSVDSKAIER